MHSPIFILENFEGTLSCLKQRIEKQEESLLELKIYDLTLQLIKKLPLSLELTSESVYYLAFFAWLKSKQLLPQQESANSEEDEALEPISEVLAEDYTLFKQIAKQFEVIHEKQKRHFLRGMPLFEKPSSEPVLIPIPLEQLTDIIQEIIKKAQPHLLSTKEEDWSLQEKIDEILSTLKQEGKIPFVHLFSSDKNRMELIVSFLALLELIKRGNIIVVEESTLKTWMVVARNE